MLGQLFNWIVSLLIKRPLFFAGILIGCALLCFFGIQRLVVNDSIYAIFPKGNKYESYSKILRENKLNKQVFFAIPYSEENAEIEYLEGLASKLQKATGNLLIEIETHQEDEQQQVLKTLLNNTPVFLNSSDYASIELKLAPDSIRKSLTSIHQKLSAGNGLFYQEYISRDPLGIASSFLQRVNPQNDSSAIQLENGLLITNDGKQIVFLATLNFDATDSAKNALLNKRLQKFKSNIKKQQPRFEYFGTFEIAYQNATQIKHDSTTTSLVGFGLILLILIFYYRSILAPLYFILPSVFGGAFGLAMAGYFHPEISAIAIATSSVLVGIMLDYAFHFFTHLKHSESLFETVKSISFPMLIGSFTTVAAFASLIYTDSVILQDFGWIALFSLIGSALFTVLVLPPIVHFTHFKLSSNEKTIVRAPSKRKKLAVRLAIYSIIACTIYFSFNARLSFDSDLNNLGFHSKKLADKEDLFTGINPKKDKKIHFFASGKTLEEAKINNLKIYRKLVDSKVDFQLENITSCAPFFISREDSLTGKQEWNSFWEKRKTDVSSDIKQISDEVGLSANAFAPFTEWIGASSNQSQHQGEKDIQNIQKLINHSESGYTILTSVVVPKNQLSDFKVEFNSIDEVFLMDVSDLAQILLKSVQKDFNYLILFSSLIVFFSLLLIYGRIELALLSFFPMIVSWIWILGISELLGIQFNFINIIVATFIFGLGDDFSIFVTDGLLQQHKFNTSVLKSYQTAIVLSGITTIIGTGVLIFAEHPAIHSIATISIVGIGCILLVTLLIQPLIFRFFVLNRTAKGKSPATLFNFVYSMLLFTYFFIGCMSLNSLLLPIICLPISRKRKGIWLNFLVSKLAKSTMYAGVHIKKRIHNKELLNPSEPCIIIANHSSFLDILLTLMLHPKNIIVVKSWVYNSPIFGLFIRYSGYLFVKDGMEHNLDLVKKRIEEGYSIIIFPEGSRSKDGNINRFHKGAFYLAEALHLDIQPVLLFGAHFINSRNDFMIRNGYIHIQLLPRIPYNAENFGTHYSERTKKITAYMRNEYELLKHEKAKSSYWWPLIFDNYVFKGPVLEWYIRIKWKLERKNFEQYDELIGKRLNIADIGCGYGYLSYYLHYRNPKRTILGVDYDTEKIEIAQHGKHKSDQLQFIAEDIREMNFEGKEAVIVNDVLHYLPMNEQINVLNKIAIALPNDGLLLIRDGIRDLQKRHKKTAFTEFLSTKLFRFNKTTTALHFFSSEEINRWAKENNFSIEQINQSARTSNVLFVLTKKGMS